MSDQSPKRDATSYKDLLVVVPILASTIALAWEVGCFIPTGGFTFFSFSEHLMAAGYALPFALFLAIGFGMFFAWQLRPSRRRPVAYKIDFEKNKFVNVMFSCLFVFGLISLAYFLGYRHQEAFSIALPLVLIVAFCIFGLLKYELGNAISMGFIVIAILVTTLTLAFDATMARLRLAPENAAIITTKQGSLNGIILMSGASGVLIYRTDLRQLHLESVSEIKSIQWPLTFRFGTPPDLRQVSQGAVVQ